MSAGGPLIDGDWLQARLGDPDLVILEIDERPLIYRVGHIPGAHCLDWRTELQDPVTRDLPDAGAMAGLCARVGITAASTVVLYGDKSNWYACFGFWLLRHYGIADLRLLDGGRQAWLAEGRPLSVDEPEVPAGRETVLPRAGTGVRAMLADVQAAIGGAVQLLDVRTAAEYRGEVLTEPGYPQEGAQRPGHIPTAINVPWDVAVDQDGRVLPEARLRERLREHGVDLNRPAITYCRIGERSAHTWFVLSELLGLRARNYDGSWTEWGSMVGMPVAVGNGERPAAAADPADAGVGTGGAGAVDPPSN